MTHDSHRTPEPFKKFHTAYIKANENSIKIVSLDNIDIGNVYYSGIMGRLEQELGKNSIEAKSVNLYMDRYNNITVVGKRHIHSMDFVFTYRYTQNVEILEACNGE